MPAPQPINTLFLSDLHMGASKYAFQGQELLACLNHYQPQKIIINGDFIALPHFDSTDKYYKNALFNRLFPPVWGETCHRILARFAELHTQGTEILLMSGNHDSYTDHYLQQDREFYTFDELSPAIQKQLNIPVSHYEKVFRLQKPFIHTTANGLKIYLEHGHAYSDIAPNHPLIYPLAAYIVSGRRRAGALKRWFLYTLHQVDKQAAATALAQGAHATMTGHFHAPDARKLTIKGNPMLYLNTGDWLGNATAIIEDQTGNLALVNWYTGHETRRPIPLTAQHEA